MSLLGITAVSLSQVGIVKHLPDPPLDSFDSDKVNSSDTIYGAKSAPGSSDLHLGKYGYDTQQTGDFIDPNRPNNLWEPVAGDHGVHGIFDDRSYSFSPQAWVNMNRGWLAIAGASLLAGTALLWRKKR